MTIYLTIFIAFMAGYIYGHKIRPNKRLRRAIQDVKERCAAILEGGNRGVYKTVVTDAANKSSELVVEVKQLAVTKNGQVKVQYLSAFYKNPEFRTKKGDALLAEVHGLLGEYLPAEDIEWYESSAQRSNVENFVNYINTTYHKHTQV